MKSNLSTLKKVFSFKEEKLFDAMQMPYSFSKGLKAFLIDTGKFYHDF